MPFLPSRQSLDDFLIMGDPKSQVCEQTLRRALEMYARLGAPIPAYKTEDPWVAITFLGIELNTRTIMVCLPDEKLFCVTEVIRRWQGRYLRTKRELQSLVGVDCVVKPGRTFLRCMLDVLWLPSATEPHHYIRLNKDFQSNLQWWATFLPTRNGVRMFSKTPATAATTSDARLQGIFINGAMPWFQYQWHRTGHHSEGTASYCVSSGYVGPRVGETDGSVLVRQCSYGSYPNQGHQMQVSNATNAKFTARHNITLVAQHIPGIENKGQMLFPAMTISHFWHRHQEPKSPPHSSPKRS